MKYADSYCSHGNGGGGIIDWEIVDLFMELKLTQDTNEFTWLMFSSEQGLLH